MQVAILCGGMGTRLGDLAQGKPKALVPVAGRPFVEHQLDLLRRQELTDVLLCAGFRADLIRDHLGDGGRFGLRLRYSLEPEDRLLGTGGALVNALPQLEDRFLVLYGDSYLPTDYRALVRAFEASGALAMMSVFRNLGRWDASNVRLDGGRVALYSKATRPGEADYIDYGLTALRREALAPYARRAMPLDLAVMYGDLVAAGRMAAFEVSDRFYEIGKPEGLAELDAWLRQRPGNRGTSV